MTERRETVIKAIRHENPERIPLLYAYSLEKSDIVNIPVVNHFLPGGISEWGFEWDHLGNQLLMGQPKGQVIKGYDRLGDFTPPDPFSPLRFSHVAQTMEKYGPDRFYKANFILSGFAIMTMLRGYNGIMEDLYLERVSAEKLCDLVFGFENEVIKQLPKHGFSAVGLADDWGTQTSLMINPEMWREIFKPRYKEQIALAHSLGLYVYMHSCGYIFDIIGDLIEIGLDILNPGQPDINNVSEMGGCFGGRICFACPPSYQGAAVSGDREAVVSQIRQYKNCLLKNGGLIGIIPEDSAPLGISKETFELMEMTFNEDLSV
jgi:hypothetical protein